MRYVFVAQLFLFDGLKRIMPCHYALPMKGYLVKEVVVVLDMSYLGLIVNALKNVSFPTSYSEQ